MDRGPLAFSLSLRFLFQVALSFGQSDPFLTPFGDVRGHPRSFERHVPYAGQAFFIHVCEGPFMKPQVPRILLWDSSRPEDGLREIHRGHIEDNPPKYKGVAGFGDVCLFEVWRYRPVRRVVKAYDRRTNEWRDTDLALGWMLDRDSNRCLFWIRSSDRLGWNPGEPTSSPEPSEVHCLDMGNLKIRRVGNHRFFDEVGRAMDGSFFFVTNEERPALVHFDFVSERFEPWCEVEEGLRSALRNGQPFHLMASGDYILIEAWLESGHALRAVPTKGPRACRLVRDGIAIEKLFGGAFPTIPLTYIGNDHIVIASTDTNRGIVSVESLKRQGLFRPDEDRAEFGEFYSANPDRGWCKTEVIDMKTGSTAWTGEPTLYAGSPVMKKPPDRFMEMYEDYVRPLRSAFTNSAPERFLTRDEKLVLADGTPVPVVQYGQMSADGRYYGSTEAGLDYVKTVRIAITDGETGKSWQYTLTPETGGDIHVEEYGWIGN